MLANPDMNLSILEWMILGKSGMVILEKNQQG
jgi:hypothetical protein